MNINPIKHKVINKSGKILFLNLYQRGDTNEFWLVSSIFTPEKKNVQNLGLTQEIIDGGYKEAVLKFNKEIERLEKLELI